MSNFIPTYNDPAQNTEGLLPFWYEATLMSMSHNGHLVSKTRMGSLYAENASDALTVLHKLAKDNWNGELRHASILEVNADGETKEVVARTSVGGNGIFPDTETRTRKEVAPYHEVHSNPYGFGSMEGIAEVYKADRTINPLVFGTRWGAQREFPTFRLEEFIKDD